MEGTLKPDVLTGDDWFIVEFSHMQKGKMFCGRCTQNWETYQQFRIEEDESFIHPLDGTFKDYEHFAGVFGKFDPYCRFLHKPPISKLTYEALMDVKEFAYPYPDD